LPNVTEVLALLFTALNPPDPPWPDITNYITLHYIEIF